MANFNSRGKTIVASVRCSIRLTNESKFPFLSEWVGNSRGKVDSGRKRGADESVQAYCTLSPPEKQTQIERDLLRAIVESNFEAFRKLHSEQRLNREIWATWNNKISLFSGHGKVRLEDLILPYADLEFIKKCQKYNAFDFDSGATMCVVAASGRLDVLEYFAALGYSVDVPDANFALRFIVPRPTDISKLYNDLLR